MIMVQKYQPPRQEKEVRKTSKTVLLPIQKILKRLNLESEELEIKKRDEKDWPDICSSLQISPTPKLSSDYICHFSASSRV